MRGTKEAWWIIDQLVQQGVSLFCISPGSRNSPLILAAAEHPKARTVVHFDERGLGFYGLGYGKGGKRPAAVLVTSGTSLGNLLPSIMEAHHNCTPLILVTADRPSELRDCGANQTCDQVKIFSPYLRWEVDAPPQQEESYFRSITAQAVFQSLTNPPGPVQINCQFREPFSVSDPPQIQGKPILFSFPRLISEPVEIPSSRGVILLGEIDSDPTPVLNLAKRLKWPLFADILSNARSYPTDEQIFHFDTILKEKNGSKPEFVLHFGKRLTSKKILDWPVDMHVAREPYLQDPKRTLSIRIQSDIASFCGSFKAPSHPNWLTEWQKKDREINKKLIEQFDALTSCIESKWIKELSPLIPPNAAVFLGNGMPIREADRFLFPSKTKGFFANRGLSGIDGNIATAAGLIEAIKAPVVAILGDQTCLHDLNSLALLKNTTHPLILIISNNFGGGIFSHLPISNAPCFETHIAASHQWNFQKAAEMFSIPYTNSLEGLSFQTSCIIELITSRKENYQFHQHLHSECLNRQ